MDEPFLQQQQQQQQQPEASNSTRVPSSSPWREFPTAAYLDLITTTNNDHHLSLPPIITSTAATTPKTASYINLIANLNKKRRKLKHRSHSAPSVLTYDVRQQSGFNDSIDPRPAPTSTPLIVRQASVGLVLYLIVGLVIYLTVGTFKGIVTFRPVDTLYFIVVTLCTIGYGDIVPDNTFTKLFTCAFILVGFGFIDVLLHGLVTYICDRQEAVLLTTVNENGLNALVRTYMIDEQKGRMRIRMKVFLALSVVIFCLAIGTIAIHFLERLDWVDSFYMSVISVTTVGYGDYSFTTLPGRCFAVVWLLVSTLAVARAFLYLAELRIDRRNRRIAKWVLQKKMTLGDLVAADLDNDGSIR
ncbi:hypothetical protein ACFE04_000652 [Oxalis oulophora]